MLGRNTCFHTPPDQKTHIRHVYGSLVCRTMVPCREQLFSQFKNVSPGRVLGLESKVFGAGEHMQLHQYKLLISLRVRQGAQLACMAPKSPNHDQYSDVHACSTGKVLRIARIAGKGWQLAALQTVGLQCNRNATGSGASDDKGGTHVDSTCTQQHTERVALVARRHVKCIRLLQIIPNGTSSCFGVCRQPSRGHKRQVHVLIACRRQLAWRRH